MSCVFKAAIAITQGSEKSDCSLVSSFYFIQFILRSNKLKIDLLLLLHWNLKTSLACFEIRVMISLDLVDKF